MFDDHRPVIPPRRVRVTLHKTSWDGELRQWTPHQRGGWLGQVLRDGERVPVVVPAASVTQASCTI